MMPSGTATTIQSAEHDRGIAQRSERRSPKPGVGGSNPSSPAKPLWEQNADILYYEAKADRAPSLDAAVKFRTTAHYLRLARDAYLAEFGTLPESMLVNTHFQRLLP